MCLCLMIVDSFDVGDYVTATGELTTSFGVLMATKNKERTQISVKCYKEPCHDKCVMK